MRYKTLFLLYLSLLTLLIFSSWSHAGSQTRGTEITSEEMTYTGTQNLVVFTGEVYVLRSDFELWSDKLYVYLKTGDNLDPAAADAGSDDNIEKIVAEGGVRIKGDGGREGRSELLTYYPDTEIVRLEKGPILIEDRNTVEGEIIILNLKENTSQVLGGDEKRVRVLFYSDENE